ncbi:hypothetical protein BDC45DRAFT_590297 [Circinella umbellata]|nr:hypothetical protein BDC45DRAFT_590297 [Circinella umbellata]
MAQDDVEMRETPNTSQSSVVDDFLAALFASRPTAKEQEKNKSSDEPKQVEQVIEQPPQEQSKQLSFQENNNESIISNGVGVKRDRTPDEFDEYEMLSKRKHGSRATDQENYHGGGISSGIDHTSAKLNTDKHTTYNTDSYIPISSSNATMNGNNNNSAAASSFMTKMIDNSSFVTPNVRVAEEARSNVDSGYSINATNNIITPSSTTRMPVTSPNRFEQHSIQRNRDQVIPDARMVVRGLPHGSKKREILDYFSKYGTILDAYFKDTAGFIQFATREACMEAYLAENGNYFRGSQLDLSFSGPRRRDPKSRRGVGGDDGYRPTSSVRGSKGFQNENRSTRKPDEYKADRYRDSSTDSNNRRYKAYPTSPSSITSSTNEDYRSSSPQRSRRFTDSHENISNVDSYNDRRQASPARMGSRSNNNRNAGINMGRNNRSSGRGIGRNEDVGSNSNVLDRRTWDDHDSGRSSSVRGNDRYHQSLPRHDIYISKHDTHVPKHDTYRSSAGHHQHHQHSQAPIAAVSTVNTGTMANSYQQQPHQALPQEMGRQAPVAPTPGMILPKRSGNEIPIVQIVAWDNVSSSYTDFIERSFRVQRISINTLHLRYGQISRDEVVSHLIMEGVRALLVVDNAKQAQGRIYLQVFEPNEEAGDGSVRFDEYDSISVEDAIAVIQRSVAQQEQRRKQQQEQQNLSQAPIQQHVQASVPQSSYAAPRQPAVAVGSAAPAPVSMPAIDPNTLSSLIGLVKGMMQQQQPQQPQQTYTPLMNNPPAPVQPQSILSNPAFANIPPALLNSPAVQQLLASMNQQPVQQAGQSPVPVTKTPVVTSTPLSSNVGATPYLPPTTQAESSYYGNNNNNNYSQHISPQQSKAMAHPQQQQQTSGDYASSTFKDFPQQSSVGENTTSGGLSTSPYQKNGTNTATPNGSTSAEPTVSTISSGGTASATNGNNNSNNNNNNTLSNLPIGDILDKLQMFSQQQQQQAPVPQRQ